jgi:hypothetical protein
MRQLHISKQHRAGRSPKVLPSVYRRQRPAPCRPALSRSNTAHAFYSILYSDLNRINILILNALRPIKKLL